MKQTKFVVLGICLSLSMSCTDEDVVEDDQSTTTVAHHSGPNPADEAFASDVADAMVDRIVTLLFREFAVTTPANAPVGAAAIANIFDNDNSSMRLVGDVQPLQSTNRPRDDFERDALAAAKLGNNFSRTERVQGRWYVRKSIAVSTGFSPSCVHCHSNFATVSNPWVGALMVRAKIED